MGYADKLRRANRHTHLAPPLAPLARPPETLAGQGVRIKPHPRGAERPNLRTPEVHLMFT